jgi:hypothetical protein
MKFKKICWVQTSGNCCSGAWTGRIGGKRAFKIHESGPYGNYTLSSLIIGFGHPQFSNLSEAQKRAEELIEKTVKLFTK